MKCNQKTIGQGTVFKSPHPSPGIRAGVLLVVLWKGAVVSSLYLRRCDGTVTDWSAAVTASLQTLRTTAQQMQMPRSHLVSCE